jgi:phospholipid/cholesterol/gamma-HCH transport system ATP-binding protein
MVQATENSGPIVELRGVGVRFGKQVVLRDVDLSVPRGQTVAIIGESGCGKSVLLKTIIGLLRPTGGSVVYDSRDLARLDDRELTNLRSRFGFVFQQAALFDSMTVADNVAFPLRQQSMRQGEEMRRTVLRLLADVGLPDQVAGKKPAELSGGMRKRVGLARAMAMNPEIMLYDEPTTGLDPIMSDVINELILRVRRQHPITSLVVTHDMHSARKVADRIVMLYPLSRLKPGESQIIFDGSRADIERTRDPRVVQFINGEAGERLMEMREARAMVE